MQSETIDGITKAFYMYINSFVCVIGILCNIFNLTVLSSPRLKESPFTYLTALACSDLLTLLFTLSMSFTRGFTTPSIKLELFLKRFENLFFIPSANVFSAFSVYVIVALTIERFLFTRFPLNAPSYCTRSNARRVIVALFVVIFIFRMPMYFFRDSEIQTTLNTTFDENNLTTIKYKGELGKSFFQDFGKSFLL